MSQSRLRGMKRHQERQQQRQERQSIAEMDKVEGLARMIAATRCGLQQRDPFGLNLPTDIWEQARLEAEAMITSYEQLSQSDQTKIVREQGVPVYQIEVSHPAFQQKDIADLVSTFNLAMGSVDVLVIYRAVAFWVATLAIRGEVEVAPAHRKTRRQTIDAMHELLELAIDNVDLQREH